MSCLGTLVVSTREVDTIILVKETKYMKYDPLRLDEQARKPAEAFARSHE